MLIYKNKELKTEKDTAEEVCRLSGDENKERTDSYHQDTGRKDRP